MTSKFETHSATFSKLSMCPRRATAAADRCRGGERAVERRRLEAERASGSRSRRRPRPRAVLIDSTRASAAIDAVLLVKTAVACETLGVVGEACNERAIACSAEGARRADDDVDGDRVPPQTVLARVVTEMEAEFSHYKSSVLSLRAF